MLLLDGRLRFNSSHRFCSAHLIRQSHMRVATKHDCGKRRRRCQKVLTSSRLRHHHRGMIDSRPMVVNCRGAVVGKRSDEQARSYPGDLANADAFIDAGRRRAGACHRALRMQQHAGRRFKCADLCAQRLRPVGRKLRELRCRPSDKPARVRTSEADYGSLRMMANFRAAAGSPSGSPSEEFSGLTNSRECSKRTRGSTSSYQSSTAFLAWWL